VRELFNSLNLKHRIHPLTVSHVPMENCSLEMILYFCWLLMARR